MNTQQQTNWMVVRRDGTVYGEGYMQQTAEEIARELNRGLYGIVYRAERG